MRYHATGKLLNTARRRLWLQGLIDRAWLGLLLASGILGVIAILHTLSTPITMNWWVPAALLPVALATIAAALNRPSLERSARAADRWLNTHDLLTAAWYLNSQTPRSDSKAALVVLDQADQVATNSVRSLPRLRKSRHPLPMAIAVATAATSLFFLSLQGAAQSDRIPVPKLDEPQARYDAAEDHWLPAFDPGTSNSDSISEDTQFMPEQSGNAFGPSTGSALQATTGAEEGTQGESGPDVRSKSLRPTNGAGAGRIASIAPPSESNREAPAGTVDLAGLELVDLQRKPAGEAVAVDRTVSVELSPFESNDNHPGAVAQDVPAAGVAKNPFTANFGPAYRALQARYFEETSHRD
jgi:hypothetical protein